MDNILGTQLDGRYLIEELAGVGGMANVYKAFDTAENRAVAVKMLRDEYAGREEYRRRFRNECKAICSLNHPNIVKVYDVALDSPNPYIVMEYVDGITLREYMDKKGAVTPRIAVSLTAQILTALSHAHENGIVHSDVKPQNVMILEDGTIKMMDFGIARFALSTSGAPLGSAIGSVHYVSPEQARGEENVDCRTDLYSTGVMLYEMLCGRLPFDADTPAAIARQQIEKEPVPPRSLNPDIPLGLEQIALHAMAKDPDRRYQTAVEMLGDLEKYVQNPNVTFDYQNGTAPAAAKAAGAPARSSGAQPKKKKKKKITYLTAMLAVTCAFVVGAAVFIGVLLVKYKPFQKVPDIEMPSLVGVQYEQAKSSGSYADLTIVVESQDFNSSYPIGEIYEQSPAAGKTVKKGSTVRVKVSNGPLTVTLPSFVNQEATEVYAKLIEMGLYYETAEVNSDSIGEGYVVRTEPGQDEVVSAASTVKVYVSRGSGKEMVVVPDVVGSDEEAARTALTGAGLEAAVLYTARSDIEAGTVLSQTPANPTRVPTGTTVTLTVASDSVTTQQVTVRFLPPSIDHEVTFSAVQDGVKVFSKSYIPAAERTISITFQGEDSSLVDLYLDNELYASLQIDFSTGNYVWTVDNSKNFEPAQ